MATVVRASVAESEGGVSLDPDDEDEQSTRAGRHSPRLVKTARLLGWLGLVVACSVITVLRDTKDQLNADGVQQSVMSIQGPALFYWGQDRLFPLVSWVASPVADPTINLWLCLVIQAASLYGLLLLIAQRVAASLRDVLAPSASSTVVYFLALVATANSIFSPSVMHVFGIEGQPYAISWLFVGLAYEAWRKGGPVFLPLAAVAAVLAVGVNPSAVLLAAFMALVGALTRRHVVRWLCFVAMFAVLFVVWGYLQDRYAMFPTPERTPAPSYLSFSSSQLHTGFAPSLSSTLAQLAPGRTTVGVLLALGGLVTLRPPARSRMTQYAAFFAGFTLLFLALFAGNPWVEQNGYSFRYFFPVTLLIMMAVAIPVAAAVLEVASGLSDRRQARRSRLSQEHRARLRPPRSRRSWILAAPVVVAVGVVLSAAAGQLSAPQHADVLDESAATATYAEDHDIRLVSGEYWNMWPLMFEMLGPGRHSVFVAGFKSGGDRATYRQALDDQLRDRPSALAMCINAEPGVCQTYLDYWTRPGWEPIAGGANCPPPPVFGRGEPGAPAKPTCVLLRFRAAR